MNFKKLSVISLAFVLALGLTIQPATAKVSLGVDFAQNLEATENDGAANPSEIGFSNGRTNVHVYGDVAQGVEAYIEMTGPDAAADINLREGYVNLSDLIPGANVKVGQFEVNFGNTRLRRSTNADVQNNPFVGNTIVDAVAVQSGLEFSGSAAPVSWSLGLTSGEAGASPFANSRGWAIIPKVWGEFGPGITAAFSYYQVDHSDATGVADNLFNSGAGESYNAASGLTQFNNTNAAGNNVSAYQLDFGYEAPVGTDINAWWGNAEDSESTLANPIELAYYGVDVKHPLTPQTYAAARYNVATNETSGLTSNNTSDRIQVALGHNLNENTQMKLEYVSQTNETNAPVNNTGVDASGIIAEGSVSF